MATAQLSLNFSAIVSDQEQTYAIAYLEKAYKLYSGSTIAENNKIKGIFHHQGMPHTCVGAVHQWGLKEVNLCRLYSAEEWQLRPQRPDGNCFYWGREIQYRGQTWIMGDRLTLTINPQERAIAVAQDKIDWSLNKIARSMPYTTGERQDPNYGVEYYQRELREARSLLLEGIQDAKKLGLPVDRDRVQANLTHFNTPDNGQEPTKV